MISTAVPIELRGVRKQFADLHALNPIDLNVAPGEFVALVGASGCGKSTLLRLIAGLETPSAGDIRLAGSPPAALRAQKGIGWMAQQPALLPWRTVIANVRLPQLVNGRAAPRTETTPDNLLQLVGLADFAAAYPHTLSGGMQQRVALARMLATGAPLWLLDEPFAALDEFTRETLAQALLDLWRQFRPTVLWITHQLQEAVQMADRILLFTPRPGRIARILPVPLPHPRDTTSAPFQDVVRQARQVLREVGV